MATLIDWISPPRDVPAAPVGVQFLRTLGGVASESLRILVVLGLPEDVQLLWVGLVESGSRT
jgi:hypothetical protein